MKAWAILGSALLAACLLAAAKPGKEQSVLGGRHWVLGNRKEAALRVQASRFRTSEPGTRNPEPEIRLYRQPTGDGRPSPAPETRSPVRVFSPPPVPTVREERPRVFLRAKAWDGPSVEKISKWMKRPEYQARIDNLRRTDIGEAVYYLATGDEAAGRKAVEGLKKMTLSGTENCVLADGAQRLAALYDWLHGHPDFDEASRKDRIAHMEKWADYFVEYLRGGGVTPFFCRVPTPIAGLTCLGLALYGDSPKAEGYIRLAQQFLTEKWGTIRQMEDGAFGGGSPRLYWEFTEVSRAIAAWRSATDFDAAKWIQEHQGNWLERQMLYQIWTTYPNGWFIKNGDLWGSSHTDRYEYRTQIDAVTGMYRNGFGRTWADGMAGRWGTRDYYFSYTWNFFVFNDPEVPPRPLAGLGRTAVFSPRLHGSVCWRDSWQPDATIIHFRCGETVDHPSAYDQGRFTIFKYAPLAIKNGCKGQNDPAMGRYFKSAWSANVVIFDGPQNHGHQPKDIDIDGRPSWREWKAERDLRFKRPPTGILLATEANDRFARALGDLSGSTHPTTSAWTRELVFLGYESLLVLDRVKPGKGVQTRWLLHTINEPRVEGPVVIADCGRGRLFSRTLLPEKARLVKVGGGGRAFHHKDHQGREQSLPVTGGKPEQILGAWRLDVLPPDPGAECVYLHVLFPTDTATPAMPACSVDQEGSDLTVKVGHLAYTFRAGA